MLVSPLPASAQLPPHVVGGYTTRAFSDAYVQDSIKAAKNSFNRFLEKAAPRTRFESIAFESDDDLIAALRSGRIDIAGGSPNQIVEISRVLAIEPALVAEGLNGLFHEAVLLVAKDSGFKGLKDLEGKTLMVLEGADGGHLRLWLDTWALREAGRPTEAFFGRVTRGRNGSQTTLSCFFAKADACLVPRGTFELGVIQRGAHAILGLAHLGVGQPDDGERRQARPEMNLDGHFGRINPRERTARHGC